MKKFVWIKFLATLHKQIIEKRINHCYMQFKFGEKKYQLPIYCKHGKQHIYLQFRTYLHLFKGLHRTQSVVLKKTFKWTSSRNFVVDVRFWITYWSICWYRFPTSSRHGKQQIHLQLRTYIHFSKDLLSCFAENIQINIKQELFCRYSR